ncbi:MAG: ribosome silencing factor [Deltaproteobacteria bacterium]|nr:ribosome silencing factor [Deltaproteobacteria bacterium]
MNKSGMVLDKQVMTFGRLALKAGLEKGADDPVTIQVTGLSDYTDLVIILSARSDRQVKAIAEAIRSEFSKIKIKPIGVEGMAAGLWVLLDFGPLVVHVFHEPERRFYNLEDLWLDAPRLDLSQAE